MQASCSQSSSGSTVFDDDAAVDKVWRDDKRIWIHAGNSSNSQRTLVLCFDGTGDEFDSDNSNVVQLCAMLRKDDTTEQLVYYQAGIGTYAESGFAPITAITATLDEMFAIKLGTHIKEGYEFLMQNYTRGDKICIFGFSRGAYTARALAGMLQKVGLLPLHNFHQVPFAYNMYKREDPEGLELSELFKRTFCRQVHIDFLGVWDTVASVGAIPRYLPFVNENNSIRYLRHALALDERRIKFLPSYCIDTRKKQDNDPRDESGTRKQPKRSGSASKQYEDAINAQERATDVKEVWFAGVHSDVGGGSVKNDTPNALSRIPLRWMIRECFRCDTGIVFDAVMLQQIGLSVTRDKSGEVVLLDVPKRLPAEPPLERQAEETTTFSVFLNALAHLTWAVVSAPFKYLGSVFSTSLHAATHAKYRRQVLPARRQEPIEYRLREDIGPDYEAEQERNDALSPLYDQLMASWLWIVMEYLPMRIKKQKAIVQEIENSKGFKWIVNRGRGRKIIKKEMENGLKVHRSVKTRLEAGPIFFNMHYIPRVRPRLPSNGKGEARMLDHHEWNVEDAKHWEWVE